jgi:hypothetical protein
MGRGRAKAKQVKVARQLKYKSSDGSDLERLRAELAGGADSSNGTSGGSDSDYDDDEESDDESAKDAWRLRNLEDVLAPVADGDRDRVLAVEACPAQPFRGQRGRFRESSQRDVAE